LDTETLAFALAAGGLAAVNPCGFALLPAYLALFVRTTDDGSTVRAVGRAMTATGSMTLGFVGVFALFGLALTPVASAVQRWLPVGTVAIGLALVVLGVFLLAGHAPAVHVPFLQLTADPAASPSAMSLYGASYAIASLGCTIGPFLAVTATTFHAGSVASGVMAYVAYAAGMGAVVGALAVGAALASETASATLRRLMPLLTRASGVLLAVVGAYVAWYGWFELRLYAGMAVDDPIVNAAARVQSRLAAWVDHAGVGTFAIVLAALAVVAALVARFSRR
jgi:cytochrome c-type biogenesis protein